MTYPKRTGSTLMIRVLTEEHAGLRIGSALWLARSVSTGHVAHGSTEESAVESLMAGLRVLFDAVTRDGESATEWWRQQEGRITHPHFLGEFRRRESAGCLRELPAEEWPGGFRVSARHAQHTAP